MVLNDILNNSSNYLIWDDSDEPIWQDWNSTLGANNDIQNYLRENILRRFIPIKYTWPKDHPEYEPPTKKHKTWELS